MDTGCDKGEKVEKIIDSFEIHTNLYINYIRPTPQHTSNRNT